jgi:hypothetical protein
MDDSLFFQPKDLTAILPAPGYYHATIAGARFCTSSRANRMLRLALRAHAVASAFQSLADYFVLEGASSEGRSVARRRLVQLYHACGFYPEEGDEILPSHLIDIRLEVRVDHVQWANQSRLRALTYRPAWPPMLDSPAGTEGEQQEAPDA